MNVREQLERLISSLAKLGGRKLAILGIVGLAIFGVTGFAGYYLSRPSLEVLRCGPRSPGCHEHRRDAA